MPRIHCPTPLASGALVDLPAGAARHVQVLRLQPGNVITLFNGNGGEYSATVTQMGRSDVRVEIGAHDPIERESARAVHVAVGMPANERMDWLVEKATELGVASIQPLITERSVLRLSGERAAKKTAHWQAVAVAACEQSGRNRVPVLHPVADWSQWLRSLSSAEASPAMGRALLSLGADSVPLPQAFGREQPVLLVAGPEGGLSPQEESSARALGFRAVTLGPRVLRSETAPLAALAALAF